MAQHKRKRAKKRPAKTYDLKALRRKWKAEQRLRQGKAPDRRRTSPFVFLFCAAVALGAYGVYGCVKRFGC